MLAIVGWACWIIANIIILCYGVGITFFFTLAQMLGGRRMCGGQVVGIIIIAVAVISFCKAWVAIPFQLTMN